MTRLILIKGAFPDRFRFVLLGSWRRRLHFLAIFVKDNKQNQFIRPSKGHLFLGFPEGKYSLPLAVFHTLPLSSRRQKVSRPKLAQISMQQFWLKYEKREDVRGELTESGCAVMNHETRSILMKLSAWPWGGGIVTRSHLFLPRARVGFRLMKYSSEVR